MVLRVIHVLPYDALEMRGRRSVVRKAGGRLNGLAVDGDGDKLPARCAGLPLHYPEIR